MTVVAASEVNDRVRVCAVEVGTPEADNWGGMGELAQVALCGFRECFAGVGGTQLKGWRLFGEEMNSRNGISGAGRSAWVR